MKLKISALLLVCGLLCGTSASENLTKDKTVYLRLVEEPAWKPSSRKRVAEEVQIFPECQYKYALYQNYLGDFVDRPLFFNRAWRPLRFEYMNAESFLKDIEIMMSYGMNGGGNIASAAFPLYQLANRFLCENAQKVPVSYRQFPIISYGEHGKYRIDPTRTEKILEIALNSDFSPRIRGRIPIMTYNSGRIAPEVMKNYIGELKRKFGDTFVILVEFTVDHRDVKEYDQNGSWNRETQEKYRKKLEQHFRNFDGIQIAIPTEKRKLEYLSCPDFGIYDRYLGPHLLAELQKEENAGKLLGMTVRHGYVNQFTGHNQGEFGTRRARQTLDRIAEANPDLVMLFEWNEFNENTCWQPTLANSLVLQRLVRFYADRMRNREARPNPGDPPDIPPMALSYRRELKLGEILNMELLNIPDTGQGKPYQAALELYDQKGNILLRFPEETFTSSRMKAVTYRIKSECFHGQRVLLPKLTLTGLNSKKSYVYRDLQYVHLRPTLCIDYKCVRQSIRDLLVPERVSFRAVRDGSKYRFEGMMESGEKLASLEVLESGKEVYACDTENEFDRTRNDIYYGRFDTFRTINAPVAFRTCKGTELKFRDWYFPNVNFAGPWKQTRPDLVEGTAKIFKAGMKFILQLPRKHIADEILEIAVGKEKQIIALSELKKHGIFSTSFGPVRLELQRCASLPDIAPELGRKAVSFTAEHQSEHRHPIFHMRATTVSGKIYHSKPVIPDEVPEEREQLPILSESTGEIVVLPAAKALIPDLKWPLHPMAGLTLCNTYDPYFNASAGGGYHYADAFNMITPPGEGSNAPRLVRDGSDEFLRFDGKSYLHFPLETFPRGAFRIEFEVRPQPDPGTNAYVLFRHYGKILGSLSCFVKSGRIHLAYAGKNLKLHTLDTGIELQEKSWSKVAVSYDLLNLKCTVNGKTASLRMEKNPPCYFKPLVFGGHTKKEFGLPSGAQYFKGDLKSFSVRHNAENPEKSQ